METLNATVLSILKLQARRGRGKSDPQRKEGSLHSWRLRVAYNGPQTIYEMELREPLKSRASKKHTVGLNGLVEFEMLSDPEIAAGESKALRAWKRTAIVQFARASVDDCDAGECRIV